MKDIELPPLPDGVVDSELAAHIRKHISTIGDPSEAELRLQNSAAETHAVMGIAMQALAAQHQEPPQQEPSEAEMVCAEAYQVVGCLLSDLGLFETEAARKILDNLSDARMVHQDVLPWESAATAPLLARIAELEAANEAFGKRQEWWNSRMLELERENAELVKALEEARKDAEELKFLNGDLLYWVDRAVSKGNANSDTEDAYERYEQWLSARHNAAIKEQT